MKICIARLRKKPLMHCRRSIKQTGKQMNEFFSSRWNWFGPTVELQRLSGSEFQTVGPADAKARRPITQRTRGTFSCWHLADHRCWRPATSEMGMQWSARYITPETSVNEHGKLVLHPLRNVKPVWFKTRSLWSNETYPVIWSSTILKTS